MADYDALQRVVSQIWFSNYLNHLELRTKLEFPVISFFLFVLSGAFGPMLLPPESTCLMSSLAIWVEMCSPTHSSIAGGFNLNLGYLTAGIYMRARCPNCCSNDNSRIHRVHGHIRKPNLIALISSSNTPSLPGLFFSCWNQVKEECFA